MERKPLLMLTAFAVAAFSAGGILWFWQTGGGRFGPTLPTVQLRLGESIMLKVSRI